MDGRADTVAPLTMWPPFAATTSPSPMGSLAKVTPMRPRPTIRTAHGIAPAYWARTVRLRRLFNAPGENAQRGTQTGFRDHREDIHFSVFVADLAPVVV
jgi:hypothetical protein